MFWSHKIDTLTKIQSNRLGFATCAHTMAERTLQSYWAYYSAPETDIYEGDYAPTLAPYSVDLTNTAVQPAVLRDLIYLTAVLPPLSSSSTLHKRKGLPKMLDG